MKPQILIPAAIVVVALLAFGGFFVMSKKSSKTTPVQTQDQTTNTSTEGSMKKMSLKDLMGSANNQQCTFTDTTSGTSGTSYIASGKVRGDFSSNMNGTATASHMIYDGTNVYVWVDGQASGYKMSMSAMEAPQQNPNSNQNVIDVNQQVDYDCDDWSVDNSKFDLPSNIKFQDVSSMMPSGTMMKTTGTPNSNASQCAACDNLPESAKAQCRVALKCS